MSIMGRLARRAGILPTASWAMALRQNPIRLYAGELLRELPQYQTHIGINPWVPGPRTIPHNLLNSFPIPANSVAVFQVEDVFEHIDYLALTAILKEIHRVLIPGGLFRFSAPDYRCPILRTRSLKNSYDEIIFDPCGGGRVSGGRVVDGGHVWFPTYESVKALFERSAFKFDFLHYTDSDGKSVLHNIDYSLGHVSRTPDHDPRVAKAGIAMSIVVDARK